MKRSASNTELSNRELPSVEKKQRDATKTIIGDDSLEDEISNSDYHNIRDLCLVNIKKSISQDSLPKNIQTLTIESSECRFPLITSSLPDSLVSICFQISEHNYIMFRLPQDHAKLTTVCHLLQEIYTNKQVTINTKDEWEYLNDCLNLYMQQKLAVHITIPSFNESFQCIKMDNISRLVIDSANFNNDSIFKSFAASQTLEALHIASGNSNAKFSQCWYQFFSKLKDVCIGKCKWTLPGDQLLMQSMLRIDYLAAKSSHPSPPISFVVESNIHSYEILSYATDKLLITDLTFEADEIKYPLPETVKRFNWLCHTQCILNNGQDPVYFTRYLENVYFEKSPIIVYDDMKFNNSYLRVYSPFCVQYLPNCKKIKVGDKKYNLNDEKERAECNRKFFDDFIKTKNEYSQNNSEFAFWSQTFITDGEMKYEKTSSSKPFVIESNRERWIEKLYQSKITIGIRMNLMYGIRFQSIVENSQFKKLNTQSSYDKTDEKGQIVWYSAKNADIIWKLLSYGLPATYRSVFNGDITYNINTQKEWDAFFHRPPNNCRKLTCAFAPQSQQVAVHLPESIQWLEILVSSMPNFRHLPESLHTIEFGPRYNQQTHWLYPKFQSINPSLDEKGDAMLPVSVREIVFSGQEEKDKISLFYILQQDRDFFHKILALRSQASLSTTVKISLNLNRSTRTLFGAYSNIEKLILKHPYGLESINFLPSNLRFIQATTISNQVFQILPMNIEEIHTTSGSFIAERNIERMLRVFLYSDSSYKDCIQINLSPSLSEEKYISTTTTDVKVHFVITGPRKLEKYINQLTSHKWVIQTSEEWNIFKQFGILCEPKSVTVSYKTFNERLEPGMFKETKELDLSRTNFNRASIWKRNVLSYVSELSLPATFSIPLPSFESNEFEFSSSLHTIKLFNENGDFTEFQTYLLEDRNTFNKILTDRYKGSMSNYQNKESYNQQFAEFL